MVNFEGTMHGRPVRCAIRGPQDLRGDAELLARAGGMVRRRLPVQFGPPLGGGTASFEDERIAVVTLAEACDPGSARFEGLDTSLPAGAVG